MGSWVMSVYTPEQQKRLNVNELGEHLDKPSLSKTSPYLPLPDDDQQ